MLPIYNTEWWVEVSLEKLKRSGSKRHHSETSIWRWFVSGTRDVEVYLSPVILANNHPTAPLYFRMAYSKEPSSPYNLEKTHRFPLCLPMTSSDMDPQIPILCLIISWIVCPHWSIWTKCLLLQQVLIKLFSFHQVPEFLPTFNCHGPSVTALPEHQLTS